MSDIQPDLYIDAMAAEHDDAVRAERERIRPLVARWREAARSLESHNALWSSHFYDCARELERVLGEPPAETNDEFEPSRGAALIAAERRRQVEREGWTPEHDAAQDGGQLARAAGCYALYAGGIRTLPGLPGSGEVGRDWPWPGWNFKPVDDDPVRTLVKAGALIAAEIDRLTNTALRPGSPAPSAPGEEGAETT